MVVLIHKVVNSKEHKELLHIIIRLATGHQIQAMGHMCTLRCIRPQLRHSRTLLRHPRRPFHRDQCLRQTNSGYSR